MPIQARIPAFRVPSTVDVTFSLILNDGWHKPETVGGTISQWVAQSRNLGISWGAAAFAAVFCYTCLTELADETHQDELHQDELTCCRFMLEYCARAYQSFLSSPIPERFAINCWPTATTMPSWRSMTTGVRTSHRRSDGSRDQVAPFSMIHLSSALSSDPTSSMPKPSTEDCEEMVRVIASHLGQSVCTNTTRHFPVDR